MKQSDLRDYLIKLLWAEASSDAKKRAMARLLLIEQERSPLDQDDEQDAAMAAWLSQIIEIKFPRVLDKPQ